MNIKNKKMTSWLGGIFKIQKFVSLPDGLDGNECAFIYVLETLQRLDREGYISGAPMDELTDSGKKILCEIKKSGFRPSEHEIKFAMRAIKYKPVYGN